MMLDQRQMEFHHNKIDRGMQLPRYGGHGYRNAMDFAYDQE